MREHVTVKYNIYRFHTIVCAASSSLYTVWSSSKILCLDGDMFYTVQFVGFSVDD